MLRHTLVCALTLLSLPALAAPWVVLDVRHHSYNDRVRVVFDLDRNLAHRTTFDERSIWLTFPGTLKRLPCAALPGHIDMRRTDDGIRLGYPNDFWVQSFQLANPPRMVVDFYGRIGREVITPNEQAPTLQGQRCD
ncbi:hypothetical protein GH975_02485 [Litorivicinus lipolyticus]|uniref:Uncharacterized protein n=1 Tax=Litorivicinus lipolyticus TaxID=418701 RepID=A0A5Q2Q9A4_9GAMM|nr:hypothetical protein [Litorivicinus lipolyticus]QGG79494.1 hypothetical protein GH975_02485 [Litorivicinus lipolyticus]